MDKGCPVIMEGIHDLRISQEKPKLPDLVFVLAEEDIHKGYDVYAIDTNGSDEGSKLCIKRLFNFKSSYPEACCDDMRMVVCGSKLCAVGAGFDQKMNNFPREFLQFDLTNWKTKGSDDFKPDEAPKPKGAKPSPAVFVHNHLLYALAGMTYSTTHDIPDPAFEVYDPFDDDADWEPLQTPPFNQFYTNKKGDVKKRYLSGHKVVGGILYLVLSNALYTDIYYKYSIEDAKWGRIVVNKSDTLLANLTLYGLYCKWQAREDFCDWSLFHLSGTKVLAHDLKAKVDESRIQKDHNARTFYETYIIDDEYPFLVVHGLEHIDKLDVVQCDLRRSTSGFVAHLSGDIFCAVYFVNARGKQHIHACKFELNKKLPMGTGSSAFTAKILGCADDFPYWEWGFCFQWGKMESLNRGTLVLRENYTLT